jgi:hypothetical protein
LDALPARHPDRKELLHSAAELYSLSGATLYRALRRQLRPKAVRRADRGKPRTLSVTDMERYCEIVAALGQPRQRLSAARPDSVSDHDVASCAVSEIGYAIVTG